MKYSKKNGAVLLRLMCAGFIAGTLFWELLMRFAAAAGFGFDLAIGPVGFDTGALALWIRINPGSFLGAVSGWYLFTRL